MTIDKAIDILQDECCVPNSVFQQPKYQAFALGIEALKREKARREGFTSIVGTPLPGETKDDKG